MKRKRVATPKTANVESLACFAGFSDAQFHLYASYRRSATQHLETISPSVRDTLLALDPRAIFGIGFATAEYMHNRDEFDGLGRPNARMTKTGSGKKAEK